MPITTTDNILSKFKPNGESGDEFALRAGYLYYGEAVSTSSANTEFNVTIQDLTSDADGNPNTISIPGYYKGLTIAVKFNVQPKTNAQINVNGNGYKNIYYCNNLTSTYFTANALYLFVYDGTAFIAIHSYNSNMYTSAYSKTSAGTAEKTASSSGYNLRNGNYIHTVFCYSNSYAGAITLNINSTGAKPIYINGAASSSTNYTLPAGSYILYYDGTAYQVRTDGLIPGATTDNVLKSGDTMTGDLTINKSLPTLALKPDSNSVNEYKEYVDSSGNFIVSSRLNNSSDAWNNKIVLGDEYSTINNSFDIGTNIRNGNRVHALDSWLPGKSANRTFGISPDCVIIEVSYDSGATWQDAGVSDSDKTEIFSHINNNNRKYNFPKKDGAYSTDVQVRLTFSNCNYSVPPNTPETQKYNFWNDNNYVSRNFAGIPIGFYIGLYTSGKTSYADIQMANMYRPDEWIDCKMNILISNSNIAQCSYAILDTTKYLFNKNSSTNYAHNIRITFRQSTVHQTYATAIYGIIMCGWISSDINNSMCSEGVPYQVDPLTLKTTFDAAIAKRGGTSSQFLKADGSVDSNTYLTSSSTLNAENLTGTVPSSCYTDTTYDKLDSTHHSSNSTYVVQGCGTTSGKYLKDDGTWGMPTTITFRNFTT